MRRHEERLRIQFQEMRSPLNIDSDNHDSALSGTPLGRLLSLLAKYVTFPATRTNSLPPVAFLVTTGKDLFEEVTDSGPRLKTPSFHTPEVVVSEVIRGDHRLGLLGLLWHRSEAGTIFTERLVSSIEPPALPVHPPLS